jgi:uncharacterized protein
MNPWWERAIVGLPSFRRAAFTHCQDLLAKTEFRRAVLLAGPRRVGKSTVLRQLADALVKRGSEPQSVFYLDLGLAQFRTSTLDQLLSVYHQHIRPRGNHTVLLLDEVHYSPHWSLHVKALVDHFPEYRIFATGSSSFAIDRDSAESGAGRWHTVPMPTLSFGEYLRLQSIDAPPACRGLSPRAARDLPVRDLHALVRDTSNLQPAFQRYLLVGGFPETAKTDIDLAFAQSLVREDIVGRVLRRDMSDLLGVRKVVELVRLFVYLCAHSGAILNVQECASALAVTRSLVQSHLDHLLQANLIYKLESERIGGKKLLKSHNKYYVVDAGLINAILLRGQELIGQTTEMGVVVETTIVRHLMGAHVDRAPRLSYWRDADTGREVDIVAAIAGRNTAIEVKYQSSLRSDDLRGLASFTSQSHDSSAYVVTKQETDIGPMPLPARAHDTHAFALPAHLMCLLLSERDDL